MAQGGGLYEELIDTVNAVFGSHEGRRALHAKGTWCSGTFTATTRAAELCRAPHFQGEPCAALIRFSNASGDPTSHDAERDGRGMAVKLRHGGGEELDVLATMAPAFVARTPEDFLELMKLRIPDAQSGQPDMEGLGEYLRRHPEAQPAIQAVLGVEPPASFATLSYFSPHAFRLVDHAGTGTWVRYRWRPEAGEQRLPDGDARALGRDYLRAELGERLAAGPVAFELALQLAADDDPLADPTAVWPAEREHVVAGTLEVTALVDDPEVGGRIDVFDPTRVPDGIELSDDPILHARPRAYSVSAYARLGEAPDDPSEPPPRN
jgi:catalase